MKKRYGICEYIKQYPGWFERVYEVYDRIEKDINGDEIRICKCATRSLARKVVMALDQMDGAAAVTKERAK